jgi:uncharacterized membrane protein YidH (DUF202 family)
VRLDPGLQAERTLLAWQRTCLSVAAGGALLVHVSVDRLGPAGLVAGVLCLALAAFAYLASIHRYRSVHRGLDGSGRVDDVGIVGALVAAAVVTLNIAVIGILVAQVRHLLGS